MYNEKILRLLEKNMGFKYTSQSWNFALTNVHNLWELIVGKTALWTRSPWRFYESKATTEDLSCDTAFEYYEKLRANLYPSKDQKSAYSNFAYLKNWMFFWGLNLVATLWKPILAVSLAIYHTLLSLIALFSVPFCALGEGFWTLGSGILLALSQCNLSAFSRRSPKTVSPDTMSEKTQNPETENGLSSQKEALDNKQSPFSLMALCGVPFSAASKAFGTLRSGILFVFSQCDLSAFSRRSLKNVPTDPVNGQTQETKTTNGSPSTKELLNKSEAAARLELEFNYKHRLIDYKNELKKDANQTITMINKFLQRIKKTGLDLLPNLAKKSMNSQTLERCAGLAHSSKILNYAIEQHKFLHSSSNSLMPCIGNADLIYGLSVCSMKQLILKHSESSLNKKTANSNYSPEIINEHEKLFQVLQTHGCTVTEDAFNAWKGSAAHLGDSKLRNLVEEAYENQRTTQHPGPKI